MHNVVKPNFADTRCKIKKMCRRALHGHNSKDHADVGNLITFMTRIGHMSEQRSITHTFVSLLRLVSSAETKCRRVQDELTNPCERATPCW